jgi:hypothetical protein
MRRLALSLLLVSTMAFTAFSSGTSLAGGGDDPCTGEASEAVAGDRSFVQAVNPSLGAGGGGAEAVVAQPDFNRDGFADLAVSIACEDVGGIVDAGAVSVLYGSSAGLSVTGGPGAQFWTQDSPGILDQVETADEFGHVLITGDFNADGYDDLVAHSREDLEVPTLLVDAGAVQIIYGGPNGLASNAGPGNQFWTLDSPNIKGVAARGDLFGRSLGVGDFNNDGFDDLGMGSPNKDGPSGVEDSGAASVLYGSAGGLAAAHNQLWTQDSPGILDKREFNDQSGRSLASQDFNGDGFDDLAISARHETMEGPPELREAGAFSVIYGSATGLKAAAGPGNQFWTQDSPGILDQAEAQDWWSRPLKAGDFNGDGFGDVVAGAFKEDLGGLTDAGQVSVIYGGSNGLAANAGPGNQLWNQDSPGVEDSAEARDWFGRWAGVGDMNDDGFDDLVLGHPGEDLGSGVDRIDSTGALNVLYGGPNGLAADGGPGDQFWSQDSPGIVDQGEVHDWFGHGDMNVADFNGDGFADVGVGIIFEDIEGAPTVIDAGAFAVIYGSLNGLAADAGPGNQFFSQSTPGIGGDGAEESDGFGGTLGY